MALRKATRSVEFNGKPALFVEVMRAGHESAIDISNKVRQYVRHGRYPLPSTAFISMSGTTNRYRSEAD